MKRKDEDPWMAWITDSESPLKITRLQPLSFTRITASLQAMPSRIKGSTMPWTCLPIHPWGCPWLSRATAAMAPKLDLVLTTPLKLIFIQPWSGGQQAAEIWWVATKVEINSSQEQMAKVITSWGGIRWSLKTKLFLLFQIFYKKESHQNYQIVVILGINKGYYCYFLHVSIHDNFIFHILTLKTKFQWCCKYFQRFIAYRCWFIASISYL